MRADKWFYFHEKRKRKEKLNERKKEQQRTFDPSVPHVFLVSGARTTCVRGSSLEALEAFLHDGKPSDVLTGFFFQVDTGTGSACASRKWATSSLRAQDFARKLVAREFLGVSFFS